MLHLNLIILNQKEDGQQPNYDETEAGILWHIERIFEITYQISQLHTRFSHHFLPSVLLLGLKGNHLEAILDSTSPNVLLPDGHTSSYRSLLSITQLIENVSPIRLLSTLLLLGFIHLLDLLNTIIIVHTASVMYAGGEANPMNLNQMLCTSIKKVGFRGPLITSICALILSSLTTIGLSILAIIIWHLTTDRSPFLILIFGALYLALFAKHIEWSGICNMGMVISILEEKHGSVAIGISWYLSKGSRKRGFLMAFVLYAWNLLQNYHVFIMRSGIEDELEVWWKG
ncbi:hypothetical protein ACOSQ4_001739 [Xanthoceras sorbifolium]